MTEEEFAAKLQEDLASFVGKQINPEVYSHICQALEEGCERFLIKQKMQQAQKAFEDYLTNPTVYLPTEFGELKVTEVICDERNNDPLLKDNILHIDIVGTVKPAISAEHINITFTVTPPDETQNN
jgi:hypothetical protein